MQNAAARLIMDIGKYSHITPALFELHWLPVPARIHFKLLLLAFKAIHGSHPELRFRADRPKGGASFIGQPFMVSSHAEFQCPFSGYLPLILGEAVVSSHYLSHRPKSLWSIRSFDISSRRMRASVRGRSGCKSDHGRPKILRCNRFQG